MTEIFPIGSGNTKTKTKLLKILYNNIIEQKQMY